MKNGNQRLSASRILEASKIINPIFLNSPQFIAERLGKKLGLKLTIKIETLNPIRSFKGRGADFFLSTLSPDITEVVCASVGNFGQGMAYAAHAQGRNLTVFSGENANPLKIESMRAFGANVIQRGSDFEAAKAAGVVYARERHAFFVEDGKEPAISEGAGTIAMELLSQIELDYIIVPLGNGALINGVGTYVKHFSPSTKVIGVVAAGAPCMFLSWEKNKIIETASCSSIADGIAVRTPVPEALLDMRSVVDEVLLVTDESIIIAMQIIMFELGLLVEPAGASGLAAIIDHHSRFHGRKIATILTGGNITPSQMKSWLFDSKEKHYV